MKLNKQQSEILQVLKGSGVRGMNSYQWRMKYIQLPVRVKELKEKGYLITTRQPQKQEMTWKTYKNERGEWVSRQVLVKPEQLGFSSLT